ncbi:MAG TPA: hypothetical protein DEP05_01505 [Betaproteobacteria bacterium]|nr:hypothetical protein [Betaproteobacteria bacterium]
MRIAQEEVFGPVLSVIRFRDEEEAVELANEVIYGLAAGIWTKSIRRALDVSARLRCGMVWVNTYRAVSFMSPFGGYKQSGIGRETHKMMLDHYQQTKNLLVSYSPKALGFF